MAAGESHHSLETQASVQEVAEAFRTAATEAYEDSRVKKLFAATMGAKFGSKFEFFTPRASKDPFAQLEAQPSFSAGVTMPSGKAGSAAYPITVQIYILDSNNVREVQLVGLYPKRGLKRRTEDLMRQIAAVLP